MKQLLAERAGDLDLLSLLPNLLEYRMQAAAGAWQSHFETGASKKLAALSA